MPEIIERSATFSACRTYRYTLSRVWDPKGSICVFVGLNPSTADESVDDPTIRRCINFAQDWGHGRLVMLNAYAFRATNPVIMKAQREPVGLDNYAEIVDWCGRAEIIVAAWGNNIDPLHERRVLNAIDRPVHCLRITKKQHPEHPLYMPKDTRPLLFWTPEVANA